MSDDLRERVRWALDRRLHVSGLRLGYALLDALTDAVLAVVEPQWQPIETAPRGIGRIF